MTRRHFSLAFAAATVPASKTPVCGFSKHFQWLPLPEAAKLAASIGYDGLDLTLRKNGHIEPARVTDDLPKAVEQVKAAGIAVPMVTTDIVDPQSPHAETVIKTLAQLGIKRYRWGGFRYDYSKPLPPQLEDAHRRSKDLAALNKQYGVCAMYHTHSGRNQLGASMWDIWYVLRGLDHSAVGVNLDIGHATVEGGLGQGMVDFPQFLTMLKQAGFEGPIQLHMEYEELGAAHTGKSASTIPQDEFVRLCQRDLTAFRRFQREAGF